MIRLCVSNDDDGVCIHEEFMRLNYLVNHRHLMAGKVSSHLVYNG